MYRPINSIVRLIYEKYMNEQRSRLNEIRDPSIVYVTDLVSCTHKYHLRKMYPELSLAFEPIAILGNLAHLGLGSILREKNIDIEVEVSKEIELNDRKYVVKGRIDALDRVNNVVVEVKTARSAVEIPREQHVKQLNIYLNILNMEKGILVYITPDKILEYLVDRVDVDLKKEVEDLRDDRYHPRYDWECMYCVYKKMCHYYKPREKT